MDYLSICKIKLYFLSLATDPKLGRSIHFIADDLTPPNYNVAPLSSFIKEMNSSVR